jgi:hypothetical protein
VCQARRPVLSERIGWQDPAEPAPASPPGYVDVYRRSRAGWPPKVAERLENALGIVHRLNSLMTGNRDLPTETTEPRPVLDLLVESPPFSMPTGGGGWPTAEPGSGYAKLLAQLAGGRTDITHDLLDDLGARPATYRWPVDCLVRPFQNGDVALDMVACTGMIDARFVADLTELHGPLPHVANHREFLRLVDQETGVRSVEFLAPALSELAANAVHRPLYTSAWTGDPDLEMYCGPGKADYIPIHGITVRRVEGRVVTEADGEPIRVLYHTTRLPPPPFDRLLLLLLNGDTSVAAQFRRLRHALAAIPGQRHLPRITAGGSVVISPAQWLLPPGSLAGATDLDRAKALFRLRSKLGLPRWVMACAGFGGRPVPGDLDSLRAFAMLDSGDPVVLEEMAPSPTELPVTDTAAELMIRLPHNVSVAELAHRSARALSGDTVLW